MSNQYKAQAQVASFGVFMQVTVQVSELPNNESVSYNGRAGGAALLGGGGAWGALFTDDIVRLTRDTVSFEFNAALAFFNVNFFDGNSKLLGHFQGGGIGTVAGIGGGTGNWDHAVASPPAPIAPAPSLAPILGVGTDKKLYSRTTLNDVWQPAPSSGLVTGVAIVKGSQVLVLGMDQRLYTPGSLQILGLSQPLGGGAFLAITAMGEGLLGVGTDNNLYRVDTAGNFSMVPNSGSVIGVAVARNGAVFGIGTDRRLYTRATLETAAWSGPLGGGQFLAITTIGDGLLGVGTDMNLYQGDTAGNFSMVPNSGAVTAVACSL